jgi:hypothetical protein
MSHVLSLILYVWIPLIVISRAGGTNAFRGSGVLRMIPSIFIHSRERINEHRNVYVSQSIFPEEEPMDHGEIEWDFPPETPPILPITPDTNTTDSATSPSSKQERQRNVDVLTLPYDGNPSPDNFRTPTFVPHSGVLTHPFMIRWFQMDLDDYYGLSDIYTGATFLPPNYNSLWEDPVQIIFFLM